MGSTIALRTILIYFVDEKMGRLFRFLDQLFPTQILNYANLFRPSSAQSSLGLEQRLESHTKKID